MKRRQKFGEFAPFEFRISAFFNARVQFVNANNGDANIIRRESRKALADRFTASQRSHAGIRVEQVCHLLAQDRCFGQRPLSLSGKSGVRDLDFIEITRRPFRRFNRFEQNAVTEGANFR